MAIRPAFPALALAVLAAASPAAARPWTVDDVLSLRTVSDPQVPPDGRTIAYVVSELNADGSDYNTDVWLVPTAGGDARRLTNSPVADESPRWSQDGRTLAFLSDRPRPGFKAEESRTAGVPDEGKRQIWLIRPDGGEAWILSDAKGGVSAFEWSRDGRTIAFLSREPKSDERRKKEKDKDDAWTPSSLYPWTRLWAIDVASRKATQLTSGDLHVTGFSISPDGRRVAFCGQPTPLLPDQFNADLYVVPSTGGRATAIVRRPGADSDPAWSPDGKWIAFASQDGKTTDWYSNTWACVVPAAGGPVRNLSASFDERVQGLQGSDLVWGPNSDYVAFQGIAHTAQHVYRVSLQGAVTPMTRGPEVNGAMSFDAKGALAAFTREDGAHPREIWRMRLPDGAPERVTDTNPALRQLDAFPKTPVQWKGADGRDIEGLLIYPSGYRAGQKCPLVLNVHGGPAGTHTNTFSGASRTYPWPLYAQKGFAILLPNPRGSGGYGGEFRAANLRDWGGKDFEDIMAGVDALVERGIADPSRMAVCGWSYGGFMTSTVVTKTDRFRAAVVGAGVTDLVSMATTCDIPEFNRDYFDAWPWQDPQFYVDHSAVLHAGKVKTPTLVVHGERDERVPTSQGWEFYTALRKVGVPTDLLLLPRQPHGPREPRLQRTVMTWTLDWIGKYTLAAPASKPVGGRPASKPVSGRPERTDARTRNAPPADKVAGTMTR